MNKITNLIKKYSILIKEGYSFKSKMAIFFYLIKVPLSYFYKNINHNLVFDVTLKNEFGIFFCGKNMMSVWTGSSFCEENIRKYFDLKKGIFVDIGASIGTYTIPFGRTLGDKGNVIAIEPEPNNFDILKKNVELNNLKNVFLIEAACYSKNTKINLGLDEKGIGTHSILKTDSRKIVVKGKKLDTILSKLGIKNVDLIKIDVEGAEVEVLKGAKEILKSCHPKIIFEAFNENYLKKIEEILKPFGYKIEQIDKINYFAHKKS